MTALKLRLGVTGESIRVTLVNTGTSPVVVAGRLAIGYADSTDREIYAVLRDPHTGAEVGGRAQLYHRAPHSAADLWTLLPGQEIASVFHLDEWYSRPAGDLELQVVYDPAEVAARFPDVSGASVVSEPVRLGGT
ncbi:hypothetical protein [Lentzea kentuckyensis]|uniref:hypothetical protein n=1 Tax=Lentzea kentuckyensis TaxID=360086 RepID=UPI000A3C01EE|nr:hypothetical protein [Lentzea kentuckyensis]